MEGYGDETYGQRWADVYDHMVEHQSQVQTEPAVERLAELADGGRVLELAIGTGRIAVPLARRGVEVHGIDVSTDMVERMRAKEGGADIPVIFGDMADVGVEGRFEVVALVFNSLFALRTQEDQLRLYRNVADHLTEGGVFVVECFVPVPDRLVDEVRVLAVGADQLVLDVAKTDLNAQTRTVQRVELSDDGIRLRPLVLRYAWPSELDLMAQLAGLELRDRWASWDGAPFTGDSRSHISVYARSARPA